MDKQQEILDALNALREGQKEQLGQQAITLQIQQEQFAMARKQFERAEALQDRAEVIQNAGASMMTIARRALVVVLPVLFVLLAWVTWLILR